MMEVNSENIQFDPFCLVGDHHREDVHYIDNFNVIDQCGLKVLVPSGQIGSA
jgi:hypothetical protein